MKVSLFGFSNNLPNNFQKYTILEMILNIDEAFKRASNGDMTGIEEFRELYCLDDTTLTKVRKEIDKL